MPISIGEDLAIRAMAGDDRKRPDPLGMCSVGPTGIHRQRPTSILALATLASRSTNDFVKIMGPQPHRPS